MIEAGVDIGGTFTDLVMLDRTTRTLATRKVLTTHNDPSAGVIGGIRAMSDDPDRALVNVVRLVHGTTLVTNAVISQNGAPTGLLTTAGFRDVLEMRRENRQDLYDLQLNAPTPLVPRDRRKEITERVRQDGTIAVGLDADEVITKLEELRALGVTSVAVCFLHSFRNPTHERLVRDIARRLDPDLSISLSSEVAPVIREFERFSTTVINAYTLPLMNEYVDRLASEFRAHGLRRDFFMMLSDGGVAPSVTASKFPVRVLESGPAAGMTAAGTVARHVGASQAIGFDMGGTTAKVCVIHEGRPHVRTQAEVARTDRLKRGSGYPIALPIIDMLEIGAGGGSIARRDALGLLCVGPESAESRPGPACYGLGGQQPTVTDADLALGYLDPEYFAGGSLRLDIAAARTVVGRLGKQFNVAVDAMAWAVHETINEAMATALKIHLAEKGQDPRQYSLIAFGGAGPVHAFAVAQKLGVTRIVVPPNAGVESALGLITSPLALEVMRTDESSLSDLSATRVNSLLNDLEGMALDLLTGEDADGGRMQIEIAVDMRYAGQTHTLAVVLPRNRLPPDANQLLRGVFEDVYRGQYGQTLGDDLDVEAVNWRVTASSANQPGVPVVHPPPVERLDRTRSMIFGPRKADRLSCPVYRRQELAIGILLPGPLAVEEEGCTTVVGPGGQLTVDDYGNLAIEVGRGLTRNRTS